MRKGNHSLNGIVGGPREDAQVEPFVPWNTRRYAGERVADGNVTARNRNLHLTQERVIREHRVDECRRRPIIEQTVAASHNKPVVNGIGKTDTRSEVIQV